MDCRNALIEAEGHIEEALKILKQKSLIVDENTKKRTALQGLVEAYVHTGGRVGALVEVNCESDFVARTTEFRELAHHLAMQITAQDPKFISKEDVPEGAEVEAQRDCLLLQPYIIDTSMTVQDIINQTIAKTGENIKVSRFARFELGVQ